MEKEKDQEKESQAETSKTCKECQINIRKGNKFLECKRCHAPCHLKKECSGVTRDRLKLASNKDWMCKECRNPEAYATENDNNKEKGDKPKCHICKRYIKAKDKRMTCSKCTKDTHLQVDCSGESRQSIDEISNKGLMDTWLCPTCTDIEAQREERRATDHNTGEDIEFVVKDYANNEDIKILQWNADSFAAKKEEFKQLLKDLKVDIFMIQESKMTMKDKVPTIPGYTILSKPRTQPRGKEHVRGGGVLMGIRNTIPYREIKSMDIRDTNDGITEWQTFEIPLGRTEKWRITNIYIPSERAGDCRGSKEDTVITTKHWPTEKFDLIAGDFNAHASSWDEGTEIEGGEQTSIEDSRGTLIEKWMEEKNMIALNSGKPTHANRKTDRLSAPDISIVHSQYADEYEWRVLNKLGASDHFPVLITRRAKGRNNVNTKKKIRWNLKKANWEEFRDKVENDLPTEYKKKSTHKLEKILRKTITNAANKHIGTKASSVNTNGGHSDAIKEEIEIRNKLRMKVKEAGGRARWIKKCREVKEMIRKEKEDNWKEYVDTLDTKTNCKEVWKTIRNIDGRVSQRKENEVLVVDGKGYVNDKDKAKQFAKEYKKVSMIPKGPRDKIIKKQNRAFLNSEPSEKTMYEEDTTWEEVERSLKETKANSSPGEDTIPYEVIKELGPKAKEFILHLYNEIWRGKPIPQRWRTAIILPLLKDGKDPEKPGSYRPISLTDCLGKLLEKVIADRLSGFMEENKLFNDSQAGFRKARCTTDQIMKLVQTASDRIHERENGPTTIATFFDFERAFDKVWREGLLWKMTQLGIPYRFVKYVRLFLSTRKTHVEINGERGEAFYLNEGLPQGSAISPLLFLLYINDITSYMTADAAPSLFADDTAAAIECGKDREDAERRTQRNIDGISAWAKEWKMSLNVGKTKVMVISTSRNDLNWAPKLHLNGTPLETVSEYRFLGVIISSDLRFQAHVKAVIAKGKRRLKILKCLAGKDWGQQLHSQRSLYVTYIRSALEYASPAWYPWIADDWKNKIESIQNECLRVMTRMAVGSPIDFRRVEANIEPLTDRIQKNCIILWEKYTRLNDSDQRKELIMRPDIIRLQTRKGWRHATKPLINQHINRDTPTTATNPMMKIRAKTTEVELKKNKCEYTEDELARMTELKMAEINADIEIFTDGSTSGAQENGGAGIFIQDKNGNVLLEKFKAAGSLCSSYDGECVAMLEAIDWMQQQNNNELEYAIYTDSLSLTTALKMNNWKDEHEWLRRIKKRLDENTAKLTICWIPSHVNTYGNEKADALADRGTKEDQSCAPVTFRIVKAKVKNKKWTINHPRAMETFRDKRKPMEVERKWPANVKRLFTRLRSGHAKELRSYRKRIGMDSEATCIYCDADAPETIEHVLCSCEQLEERRRRNWEGNFEISMMATHPELCRKVLVGRFAQLCTERNKEEDQGGGGPSGRREPQLA